MKNNKIEKLSIFLISIILCFIFNMKGIFADSYPLTCNLAFEVSKINDDGSFKEVACYNDFASAHNKMKENEDYVVRNNKSLSPTKIVDMNSGIAYTYPYRANSLTQSIFQSIDNKKNGAGVSTYLTIHYPMTYLGNANYNEYYGYSGGWIHVDCHGFDGYADLEYVDLVPSKYIRDGIAITLGGNDKTSRNEQPFKVVCKYNTYEAVRNGNYTDLVFTFYRGWSENTNGGVGINSSTSIGVAPDFMVEGIKYYSSDGINFYSDASLKNLVGTYYNYYQFVPFRTKSNISGAILDSYLSSHTDANKSVMKGKGNDFKNAESIYGCNSTLVYAFALHESGWGKSELSKDPYNNLFGYNAVDSDVSKAYHYNSITDCINSQMGDNLANYMDVNCSTYFSMSLGNKGGGFMTKYASDPYWAEKIAHFYYDIDKFANNNNGNLSDYNSYNIALVNTYNVNVKREPNSASQTLYSTANKHGYQKNLITVIYENTNDYTKVQLSNPIDESGNVVHAIEHPKGTNEIYNFARSVGYIPSSALVPVNYSNSPVEPKAKDPMPDKMEPFVSIDSLTLNNNIITINGVGAITYSNFDDLSKIKHEFVIKNLETGNEASFNLTSEEYNGFELDDGYIYKFVGFNGSIDLSDVIEGTFKMSIKITNGEYVKEKELCSNKDIYRNMFVKFDNITNRISYNPKYGYRLELDIFKTPLDYSLINIPYNRPSSFFIDKIEISEDLNFHIEGQSFIYYLNYSSPDNVEYIIHLINNDGTSYDVDVDKKTCSINYTEEFNSRFDLSNICYEANSNIEDLEGEYTITMEIHYLENGVIKYIDYVDLTTMSNKEYPVITKNDKNYSIIKCNAKERLKVKVAANEEEN